MMTELRLPRGVKRGEWPADEAVDYLILKDRLNQKLAKREGALVDPPEK